MARRRVKLTDSQYGELVESREWCAKRGLTGFRDFYDEELGFLAGRRALPADAREYQQQDEEGVRPRIGRRPR